MRYLRLQLLLFLSVMVGMVSFAQETSTPDWRKLHYLSQEEMEAGLNNRLTNFTATAAPTGTVRFPGEFEPMQAVMVRYPLGVPTSFIKTLAEECKVITLVSSSSLSAARNAYNNAGVNMDNCEFVTISTDSYWFVTTAHGTSLSTSHPPLWTSVTTASVKATTSLQLPWLKTISTSRGTAWISPTPEATLCKMVVASACRMTSWSLRVLNTPTSTRTPSGNA